MPQVVDNKRVLITDDMVGVIYLQTYKEGKRIMEYNVETLVYFDSPNEKQMKIGFILAKMFEITVQFELVKLDADKTLFKYTTTNRPLKWFVKLMLLFSSDKVVIEFVERVKKVAESDNLN